MRPLHKLILAGLALVLFLILVGVLWMERFQAQLLCFGLLSLLLCLRRGLRGWLSEIKVIAPFFFMLLIVYLLFGLTGLPGASGKRGDLAYWLGFGLPRVLMLVNSILGIQYILSLLSFQDVLRLPLPISISKYLLLGRVLYQAAFRSHAQIETHLNLIPSLQESKLGFKARFNRMLASTLALLYHIISEARLKGELIDNRIAHCHPREK